MHNYFQRKITLCFASKTYFKLGIWSYMIKEIAFLFLSLINPRHDKDNSYNNYWNEVCGQVKPQYLLQFHQHSPSQLVLKSIKIKGDKKSLLRTLLTGRHHADCATKLLMKWTHMSPLWQESTLTHNYMMAEHQIKLQ